jgi:hypothetical protein
MLGATALAANSNNATPPTMGYTHFFAERSTSVLYTNRVQLSNHSQNGKEISVAFLLLIRAKQAHADAAATNRHRLIHNNKKSGLLRSLGFAKIALHGRQR